MQIQIDGREDLYKGKIDAEGRKDLDRELAGQKVTIALGEVHD